MEEEDEGQTSQTWEQCSRCQRVFPPGATGGPGGGLNCTTCCGFPTYWNEGSDCKHHSSEQFNRHVDGPYFQHLYLRRWDIAGVPLEDLDEVLVKLEMSIKNLNEKMDTVKATVQRLDKLTSKWEDTLVKLETFMEEIAAGTTVVSMAAAPVSHAGSTGKPLAADHHNQATPRCDQ